VKEEEGIDDEELETVLVNESNISQFTIHDLVAPLYGPNSLVPH
jgi:hypothetical protein